MFDNDGETLGKLTEDDVGKTLVKMVMRREKIGTFADKSPKAKSSSESLPFFESKQPVEKEEEDEDVEVSTYKYKGKEYDIEDLKGEDDMNLEFYANREVWEDNEPIGKLGDDTTLMKALMKLVIKQEFPSQKDYRETMGLDAKKPRASKAKAPASARVGLREELVAEQPRNPAGEFAEIEYEEKRYFGVPNKKEADAIFKQHYKDIIAEEVWKGKNKKTLPELRNRFDSIIMNANSKTAWFFEEYPKLKKYRLMKEGLRPSQFKTDYVERIPKKPKAR